MAAQPRRETSAASYRRLTFEEGTIYSARFTPDGRSIVYTAAWNNKPRQLYSTVGNSLLAQPLALSDANLLAISPSNELAVLLHGTPAGNLETTNGTLARAPMAAGSPREVLGEVRWADWDSHGELAVVHYVEAHSRLEYPIGQVLYQSSGMISQIRFSPQGDKIAFVEHPAAWDDRGSVCVTDLKGHVTVLSKEWESANGLAWSPDGKEIWFTAAERGTTRDLLAISLAGRVRTLLRSPMAMSLQDVSSDGRALVSLNSERMAMAAATRGDHAAVDLSWHDWNLAKDISRDGQWVLFEDSSEAAGDHYAVAIRKLDGTPPIRLGEGSAGGLSPDGKWAISIFTGKPERVELLPIGPGQPRTVPVSGLEHINNGPAHFLPDGKRITLNGNEPGHDTRCYVVDLQSGVAKPVTPEGILGTAVSPDGQYVLASNAAAQVSIYPLDGGSPITIPALGPEFVPLRWSTDSTALFGYRAGEIPAKVYKLDIATGKETFIQELPIGEPAGVVYVAPLIVDRDGARFAYSYFQVLSTLYVIYGVR